MITIESVIKETIKEAINAEFAALHTRIDTLERRLQNCDGSCMHTANIEKRIDDLEWKVLG